MALTQKQEAFCLAYMETGNASEAYRRAYNAENMQAGSIHVEACLLMDNPNVSLRLAELRASIVERSKLTVEDLLRELEEARIAASTGEKPQASAMVAATMGKAKILGLEAPQKIDHLSSDGTMSPKGRSLEDFYAKADVPAKSDPA